MVEVLEASQLLADLTDPDAAASLIAEPLLVVDAATFGSLQEHERQALRSRIEGLPAVTLAVVEGPAPPEPTSSDGALGGFSCLVSAADAELVATRVMDTPRAAAALDALLRVTERLPVELGVVAEAHTYSMLLAGSEFTRWLDRQPLRDDPDPSARRLRAQRRGDTLLITLCRPEVHNAFDSVMRDELCAALDVARSDSSVESVVVRGEGRSFCSGGALWEFGTAGDPVAASSVRLARNAGLRLHELSARSVVEMHGACIGAGAELAGFAGLVRAHPDTSVQLPELEMGLVPGAGGTVSLPQRIGRQRTAWLALTGRRIEVDTMMRWGLADQVVEVATR